MAALLENITPEPTRTGAALTVLYDGNCPLCRREIGVYQGLTPLANLKAGAQGDAPSLRFCDVSSPHTALPAGGTQADYMARFHVQQANGQVLSGAAAFVALWRVLPGWRWLARAASLPGATPLLEVFYRAFLTVRPTMQRAARAFGAPRAPDDLVADLRSDHAGETGAVWIYHGLLALSRDEGVRAFARRHRATEQNHLDLIEAVLPWPQRSRLLPGWRVAGFMTGALPALFGPRAVYATIAAVETFVDQHYQHQIDRLHNRPEHTELLQLLLRCQADECEHRDEALAATGQPPGALLRAWCAVVGGGSAAAVGLARKL